MKIRLLFYMVGLFFIGFGATLTIKADIGAGAWDALNVGLAESFGLTVGSWVILIGLTLIFVNAFISKHRPIYFAVITIVLIGFSVDFWLLFIFKNLVLDSLSMKFLVLVVGILAIAVGVAMYLQTKFPANPIDQLMIVLHERFSIKLMTAKTIGELSALLFAFLLKGPIGVGTILITFSIGPLIQLFHVPVAKLLERWSSK
ncbi:YitT family protein [Metabacillus herbersteinensis]|uniref:YitT family protein n=1 Tax=Metabacillus herbersteinensis TaxID=283816 RepID=A0ABV6GGU3_9BACI